MEINRTVVDRFLRVSIAVSIVSVLGMVGSLLFDLRYWTVLLPGMIAGLGVVISFGVHLNKLHGRTGMPTATVTATESPVPAEPVTRTWLQQ